MDDLQIAVAALIALLSGFAALFVWVRSTRGGVTAERDGGSDEAVVERETRQGGRRRRGGLERMRREAVGGGTAAVGRDVRIGAGGADGADGADAVDAVHAGDAAGGSADGGRVKKKKEANKEAKREAREAREAKLAEFRERQDLADEIREREKEEEERERLNEEERERKELEEKEKKEKEEYDQWKDLISVEDAGEQADALEVEDPELLGKFCNYVKTTKVVVLEELAAEFDLSTEDACSRLTELEAQGTLPGFFDDRGKFIYVSEDEMQAVADFIRKRGRISIQELAAESTSLLHLDTAPAPLSAGSTDILLVDPETELAPQPVSAS